MVYLTFQAVQNTDSFKKNFVYEKKLANDCMFIYEFFPIKSRYLVIMYKLYRLSSFTAS